MIAVNGENIRFFYDEAETPALDRVSFTIHSGELIAILGTNGCGKSTLVKHLNAIHPLQEGQLTVWNLDVSDETQLYALRRLCGMVFQNPDNQFVSSIVEEDVAFGLRNYDVPEAALPEKVAAALSLVGMEGMQRRNTHTLSGGQKQRVAMAGVLAMEPELLILDEATAMLDPEGRQEVLSCAETLRQAGKTVILITHSVEEAVTADRVFLMAEGTILKTGTPREILTDIPLLDRAQLMAPMAVRLYDDLKKQGLLLPRCPLTNEELVEALCELK